MPASLWNRPSRDDCSRRMDHARGLRLPLAARLLESSPSLMGDGKRRFWTACQSSVPSIVRGMQRDWSGVKPACMWPIFTTPLRWLTAGPGPPQAPPRTWAAKFGWMGVGMRPVPEAWWSAWVCWLWWYCCCCCGCGTGGGDIVSIMSMSRSDSVRPYGEGWQDMGAGDEDQGEKREAGSSSESESPGVRVQGTELRGTMGVDQSFEEVGEVRRGRHWRRFYGKTVSGRVPDGKQREGREKEEGKGEKCREASYISVFTEAQGAVVQLLELASITVAMSGVSGAW
ncbi:hypothetical protein ColKHC_10105 [Colletotrichum higginsianum]|nr:hypothetical protein ColKHC_10105 [Colletotrichum higginsianum]